MFEKEAKKRAKDFTDNEGRQVAYECGFLDGADRATEELKEKLAGAERTRDNLRQLGFPTFQSCKEYAEHIAELEKESKFYYEERCNYKVASLKGFVEKNKINKALTKAKELLKWALHSDPEHDEDFDQKWEEAEQFLKEGEENGI